LVAFDTRIGYNFQLLILQPFHNSFQPAPTNCSDTGRLCGGTPAPRNRWRFHPSSSSCLHECEFWGGKCV